MTGQGVCHNIFYVGAVLHPEVKPDELAHPVVLRNRGEALVQQVLKAVVVGPDDECVPSQVGSLMTHGLY
jgi:hypothetical protein